MRQHTLAALLTAGLLTCALAGGQVNPIIGNWEGSYSGSQGTGDITAKIIGLGGNEYRLVLEGQGMDAALYGTREGESAAFRGIWGEETEDDGLTNVHVLTADIYDGELEGRVRGPQYGGAQFQLERVFHEPPNLGAEPPEGAILLFDGSDTSQWRRMPEQWHVVDGAMQVGGSNLYTREEFGDHRLHLEFRTPYMPNARGQGRGNSGVYVHGRYEVQVLDSFGEPPAHDLCGGIYSIREPDADVTLPPGEWQTYDITFRAPRFDDDGEKVENAVITVIHNGVTIHDEVELPHTTPGGVSGQEAELGGIWLQDHGGDPVRFRNIWVEELDL